MTERSDTTDGGDGDDEGDTPQEHCSHHDMSGNTPLSVSIATAIGDATGTDPLRLPPLGRVVDLDFDALDDLFTTASAISDGDDGTAATGDDGAGDERADDSAAGTVDTVGTDGGDDAGSGVDAGRSRTTVRFFYDGHEVVVHGDGRIRVREAE